MPHNLRFFNPATFVRFWLLVLVFLSITRIQAQNEGLYLKPSVYAYSYTNSGLMYLVNEKPFFNQLVTAPSFGFGYGHKGLRSSIEFSYYMGIVPSVDTALDLFHVRHTYNFDYFFHINKSLKVGVGYAQVDTREQLVFFPLFGNRTTLNDGLSLHFGYDVSNTSIEVKKEIVYSFAKSEMQEIDTYYALRLAHYIPLKHSKTDVSINGEEPDDKNRFPLSFTFGFIANRSLIEKYIPPSRDVNLNFVAELDYHNKSLNTSVILNRTTWLSLTALDNNFYFSAQSNYLGVLYTLPLLEGKMRAGLHHGWIQNRSMQRYEYVVNLRELPFPNVYDSRTIGSTLTYEVLDNIELRLMCDYYYKSSPLIPLGFNRESIRLGITYNYDHL